MAGWKSKTFDPKSSEPFTISRSKIEIFQQCRRCAYLDMRLGVKRVSGPAFTLNNAVDELFKKEFDVHRANGTTHPLVKAYGLEAVPFNDERLTEWRDALKRGVKTLHAETNLIVRGGIDDVWVAPNGELIVVDYKATSKKEGPTSESMYDSYKNQLEVYQWLFRRNGFKVSSTAYLVYANGLTDRKAFDGKLEFDVTLVAHEGDDAWVEPALHALKETLTSDELPPVGKAFDGVKPCDFCTYREDAGKALWPFQKKASKK